MGTGDADPRLAPPLLALREPPQAEFAQTPVRCGRLGNQPTGKKPRPRP
jgi:hypothetical protein